MNMDGIFQDVKNSFCSLWAFKVRGNTLEVITPYSTTNLKFISVFVTLQQGQYIVTDGGWLNSSEYQVHIDYDDDIFMRIFNHYESTYNIKKLEQLKGIYYFKSTDRADLIPNLVYDLANFLSSIISTSQIQFVDQKEKEDKETFGKIADSFISGIINKEKLKFRKELGEEYKNVRFNAIVSNGNRLKLVKYITGSTLPYFLSSLTKATVDFEITNNSPFNPFIDSRVALINDSAPGFKSDKLFRYIETLEEHTKMPNIRWSEREKLGELL
jgi:hypothetical protein